MKLLLDENLPKKLKLDFFEYDIYTVTDRNWNGKKNGELLQLMQTEGFEVLITFDKNIQHQQNFKKYPITVLILNAEDNSYRTLKELVPKIKRVLHKRPSIGPMEVKFDE